MSHSTHGEYEFLCAPYFFCTPLWRKPAAFLSTTEHGPAPAPAGATALTLQVADLETKVMALQAEVTILKKMSDDTIIKVHFTEFKSTNGFAGW